MTNRIKGIYVALDQDYRVDDAEEILAAIKMVKGVLDVTGDVSDSDDWSNRTRIRHELGNALWEVLYGKKED